MVLRGVLTGRNLHTCRAQLIAAKVIPDVIDGVDLGKGINLQIKYGAVSVTSGGDQVQLSQTVQAPTVQVCHVAQAHRIGFIQCKKKI